MVDPDFLGSVVRKGVRGLPVRLVYGVSVASRASVVQWENPVSEATKATPAKRAMRVQRATPDLPASLARRACRVRRATLVRFGPTSLW